MTDFYAEGSVRIRASVIPDVMRMKDHLRVSDRREIKASHDQTPEMALRYGLRYSEFCATVLYRGEPVAMFGVVPDPKDTSVGAIWFLATDGIYKMKFTFLRLSKRFILILLKRFPLLYNFVQADNFRTVYWLMWCGAKVGSPVPFGYYLKPFCHFAFTESVKEACHL